MHECAAQVDDYGYEHGYVVGGHEKGYPHEGVEHFGGEECR